VRCVITLEHADVTVDIAVEEAYPPPLTDVRTVCQGAGIGLTQAPGGVTLRFPVR
jgi:hypothetical protein